MKEKSNTYKYYITSFVVIIILSIAAGFYVYSERKKTPILEENDQFIFSIDGRNYIMPSPFHSFHFLNSMNFQWEGLAEYNPINNYSNESQTAMNLGSRAASGIVMLFANEREKARETRSIVIELADKLEITPGIREAVSALDNAVIVNANKSILDERIIHLQYQMEKALHKKKKDNLAVLVELGGWLEGLNIASKGIKNNYNPGFAEILRQPHIAEIYIEILTVLSQKSSDEKEKLFLNSIIEQLIKISKVANHTHKESFPLEKVKQLDEISTVVKKIIESNNDSPQK